MSQFISLLHHIVLRPTGHLKQYYYFQNAEMEIFPKTYLLRLLLFKDI